MKYHFVFLLGMLSMVIAVSGQAPVRRIDSTVKIGKTGYRVVCNNKNSDKNELSIKPVGFENTARPMDFYVKGRVAKSEIDDLNNDGFPDLLVYIYTTDSAAYGTAYAFISGENKSIIPTVVPEVLLDGKIKDGYKGHDEFSLLEGRLMRKFPLYKTEGEKNKPTGGSRVVQYQLQGSAETGYTFKVLRSFETK